jgi:hypothetical protein
MQAHPNASRFVQKETRDPTKDKKASTPNCPQMIWCIEAKNKVFGAASHRIAASVLCCTISRKEFVKKKVCRGGRGPSQRYDSMHP